MMKYSFRRYLAELIAACVLFGIGLYGPAMTIVPHFGELSRTVKLLKPNFDSPKTLSIASGIETLFSTGEFLIGGFILVFSVLFPLWKLGVLWAGVMEEQLGKSPSKALLFIEHLGKFSMIDVFVLALLALSIKGLPGGSEVHLRWGLFVFCGSILLSMHLTHVLAGSTSVKAENK